MITRLKLKNYKNIRELDLKLGPLNVIIGPNGVGKSNVGRFLSALYNVFPMGTLGDLVSALDGPQGLFPHLDDSPKTFHASVEGSSPQGNAVDASFGLTLSSDHAIEVVDESYNLAHARGHRIAYVREGRNRWRRTDSTTGNKGVNEAILDINGPIESAEPLSAHARRLFENGPFFLLAGVHSSRWLSNRESFPRGTSELLYAWHDVFTPPLTYLDVQQMTRKSHYVLPPKTLDYVLSPVIPVSSDLGSELQFVEWLYEHRSPFDESRFVLENLLRASMPSFESFYFQTLDDGSRFVQIQTNNKGRPLGLGLMSNGFLAMLRVASAIAHRQETIQSGGADSHSRSPFYCEEPEVLLHPSAQAILAEALIGLSEKTQVFVSTHSPSFLRHFPLESIIIGRFSPVPERFPEFVRLEDDKYALAWLGEDGYNVAEAWTMGVFGD